MKREYESDIIEMCHEEALALHKLGAISDERMKEFDKMAFAPGLVPEAPKVSSQTRRAAAGGRRVPVAADSAGR